MGFKKIYSFDSFSTIALECDHTLYKYFYSQIELDDGIKLQF